MKVGQIGPTFLVSEKTVNFFGVKPGAPCSTLKMRKSHKKLARVYAYTHAYTQIRDWGGQICPPPVIIGLRELTSSCWKMRTSESQGQVQQGPFAWQHRRFPKWCNWGYFSNTVSQLNSILRLHLLLVGGVQSENPHEEEVGARTENENWSWEGERVEEIPEKTKHGNGHCDPTDPQPEIALFYWYSSDHVRLRCQTFYSLRVYMNSGGSWVMTCTFHP